MKQTLYVISDLHLGGAPATAQKPGFQMSDSEGRRRLATFIKSLGDQHKPQNPTHLVINGDFIDFLAEEPFRPFTVSESEALKKLQKAIEHSQNVFDALRIYCGTGARLTLMVGNHDIELSLPSVRRGLMDCLNNSNVSFLYDNEALQVGPVLIEHGNRYDTWNAVQHDALRAVRSALSRQEVPPSFPVPPGSLLVCSVMNEIKAQYPFIDLLKPETSAAIPILAVLAPEKIWELNEIGRWHKNYQLLFKASWARLASDSEGRRLGHGYISAELSPEPSEPAAPGVPRLRGMSAPLGEPSRGGREDDTEAALALAHSLVEAIQPGSGKMASPLKLLDKIAQTAGFAFRLGVAQNRIATVSSLLRSLRYYYKNDPRYLDINHESPMYQKSIEERWKKHKVVIYGHTHLAKYWKRDDRLYINTGTWADLMLVPRAVFDGDEERAFVELYQFVDNLGDNQLQKWKHQLPTYAKVELGSGDGWDAQLCVAGTGEPDKQMLSGSLWDWHAASPTVQVSNVKNAQEE